VAGLLWFSEQQPPTQLLVSPPTETEAYSAEEPEVRFDLLPDADHQASFAPGQTPAGEIAEETGIAGRGEDKLPPAPETAPAAEAEPLCTLSVRCDMVLDKADQVHADIMTRQPADGNVFFSDSVSLEDGDTAFTVLQREMRAAGIHMESSFTPAYNSAYIEGINHLYEMDAGELSGWLYAVNGVSPGVACSAYALEPGDSVAFLYTCDMGRDVGLNVAY
ncbi:MAG: DUF4430 domain-containing protein, partial [Syntrophomonadaceae bacterium]|nr:DUF4430 domain-containing protein [Syntrophomonadaceae bacterium]